jgi:hypothetical protein
MAKKKPITQPTAEDEQLYNDVVNNNVSVVSVRDKVWSVKWKHHISLRKVTNLLLKADEDEAKVVCKCVSILRLDSWWKIPLFHWFLWRWYYYVKCYTEEELLPYIEECKKKVPVQGYYGCIMLLTAMKDTSMMMTRAEVNRIQAEQITERLGALEKSDRP